MNEREIKKIWTFIQDNFTLKPKFPTWEDIESDSPSDDEKVILSNIDEDDADFISQEELLKQLNIEVD